VLEVLNRANYCVFTNQAQFRPELAQTQNQVMRTTATLEAQFLSYCGFCCLADSVSCAQEKEWFVAVVRIGFFGLLRLRLPQLAEPDNQRKSSQCDHGGYFFGPFGSFSPPGELKDQCI
jgi:hypothetical protein